MNNLDKRTRLQLEVPGVATIGIGILTLLMVFSTTRISVDMVGWGLLFAGLLQFVFSVATGHWSGFAMHLFLAFTYCVSGIIAVMGPIGESTYSVALFMSLLFMTSGVLRMVISLTLPFSTWTWALGSGLVTTAFGVYTVLQPQGPGPNLIGLLIAIDLILFGAYMIAFGMSKDARAVRDESDVPNPMTSF